MNSAPVTNPWRYRFKAAAITLILLLVITAVPFLFDLATKENTTLTPWYTRLLFAMMKGLTFAYFFFIGSSIGSFINVVAYRMPLGKSVITTPSSCPRCRKRIRGQDNLPVFGWILLGGKCRNCALPISARYPLVEFWFGCMAGFLFLFEAILGASNIPGRDQPYRIGVVEMIWGRKVDVFWIYGYHFLLVSALATLALFKLDRNRIPWKAGAFFLVTLATLPAIQFLLHPVTAFPVEAPTTTITSLSLAIGWSVGVLMGLWMEACVANAGFNRFGHKGFWLASGLVGLALGWQAALSTAILFSLLFFFSRFFVDQWLLARGPMLAMFNVAALLQIGLWKSLGEVPAWPSVGVDGISIGVAVAATTVLLLAGRFLVPHPDALDDYISEGYGNEVPELVDVGEHDAGEPTGGDPTEGEQNAGDEDETTDPSSARPPNAKHSDVESADSQYSDQSATGGNPATDSFSQELDIEPEP